jgi:hypothetical protein
LENGGKVYVGYNQMGDDNYSVEHWNEGVDFGGMGGAVQMKEPGWPDMDEGTFWEEFERMMR